MKKSILTIAVAFGMAMSMSATATLATAHEEYVEVRRDNTPLFQPTSNSNVEMCRVPQGTRLKVVRREGSHIIVEVLERQGSGLGYCFLGQEYNITRNRVVSVQSDSASGASGASGQEENTQQVFTGGRWGNEVPVFKQRRAYYDARRSMDRNGHYNGQTNQVACTLRVGTAVDEFKPFRDWGTGEVRYGNCSGWTDRAVIR